MDATKYQEDLDMIVKHDVVARMTCTAQCADDLEIQAVVTARQITGPVAFRVRRKSDGRTGIVIIQSYDLGDWLSTVMAIHRYLDGQTAAAREAALTAALKELDQAETRAQELQARVHALMAVPA